MPKKITNSTDVKTSTKTGVVDLTTTASASDVKKDDREAEEILAKAQKSFNERLANHEGGEWMRYGKSLAKTFGKAYSTIIFPITYNFQEGLKTFVLDEHVESIIDIFDRRLRAEGADISQSQFTDEELNPENMINGGSL